jgi:hypothetical protein
MPSHIGGPVEYFQVLVKKNGEQVELEKEAREVPYKTGESIHSIECGRYKESGWCGRDFIVKILFTGKPSYYDQVQLSCESNTNVTAQVRAVTRVNEEKLFGDWSPEGEFSCYGESNDDLENSLNDYFPLS